MSRRPALAALAALLALAAPAAAQAAAPGNDAPAAASEFAVITAENGVPSERQGIAELAEATGDPGVPPCLGAGSFARTVWFRVAAADAPRELSVEASGRTLAVVDVALFVQPEGATAPSTAEPNACGGAGAGGADASEEPTGGAALRVPAGRAVLVQIGRRGAPGSAADERAVVSLAARDLPADPRPAGDEAGSATPTLASGDPFAIGGATTTAEDPAQPPCPSLGSVWRRVVPLGSGPRTVVATGAQVATLALFAGERPTGDNVTACVNRERSDGELALSVTASRGAPLWVRVGTDRPGAGATATLRFEDGPPVSDGGAGGGPPVAVPPRSAPGRTSRRCPALGRAPRPGRRDTRVRFAAVGGRAADRNRARRLVVRVARLTGRKRAGRVVLVGPCRRVYARSSFRALRTGGRVTLTRLPGRPLVRGTYRLQVDVRRSTRGKRTYVPTTARVRLR